MDIYKILVRTRCSMVLNEVFNVSIDGIILNIKVAEDVGTIFVHALKRF